MGHPTSDLSQYVAGIVCGLLAALIWGGGAVVSRHLVTANFNPADLTLLRYIGCFPVALALLIVRGESIWPRMGWRKLIVLLLLAGPPYHALVIAGYGHATAGAGPLLMCGLLPIFALAISSISDRAAPSWSTVSGVAGVLAGLLLFGTGTSASLTGVSIFASAALAWAALNECVRRWRVDALHLTVSLALFSPLFIPLYLIERSSVSFSAPSAELMLQFVYHGWVVAVGATALFFASVKLAGATAAAILQTLSPIFAAALGATLLGEALTLVQASGLIVTFAGVLISMRVLGSNGGALVDLRTALTWVRGSLSGPGLRLRPTRGP